MSAPTLRVLGLILGLTLLTQEAYAICDAPRPSSDQFKHSTTTAPALQPFTHKSYEFTYGDASSGRCWRLTFLETSSTGGLVHYAWGNLYEGGVQIPSTDKAGFELRPGTLNTSDNVTRLQIDGDSGRTWLELQGKSITYRHKRGMNRNVTKEMVPSSN